MAKLSKQSTKKAPPRKRPGRKARPKKQQASSVNAIIREHVKKLAGAYRLQNFSITAIADAINEAHGAEGELASENPDLVAAFWKVHKKGVSRHHVHDLIVESIQEAVDPLQKEQLKQLEIQQLDAVITAMIGPAMQGSVPHAAQYQSLRRDKAKLLGLEDDGDTGGPGITQIFLNGSPLAEI